MEKDSRIPVYIAILIAVVLVAAAAYYVLGSSNNQAADSEKTVNIAKSDSSASYSFVDRENGVITIKVSGTAAYGEKYRDYYIDALEDGYSKLKSRCKIIDRHVLASYNGRTTSYSVDVEEPCNP